MQTKQLNVKCKCGSDEPKQEVGSLMQKITDGAKELERLVSMDPMDMLGRAPMGTLSAKECGECGTVYFKGEDERVDAGLKCGNCAYRV
jgi:hypothetical protein